jgi:hydrogenase maturation protein HypF
MPPTLSPAPQRLRLAVRGGVQGVGFRPFIFRLATELGLAGWVNNSAQGVFIELEGPQTSLEQFLLRIEAEKPPRSFIQGLEPTWLDPVGYGSFEIRPSETGGAKTVLVMPDIATCPDCQREIFDPNNWRYHYPFTNCTNCGPRFSIIESLPYDRANTSMKGFVMCPQCQAEYDDPRDRRFHAQPNACPVCGPRLELWSREGKIVTSDASKLLPERSYEALLAAAEAIRAGKIVAVKGLGGFHLMVAAHDEPAVRRLRELKHREEKPFALMFPSLAGVKVACAVSPLEARLLRSPEAPIVLLPRRRVSDVGHPTEAANQALPASLAPNNPNLGVMLPYTPLHHVLLSALGFPVVATSGNLSDEPICTDEREARERLGRIADLFLIHNRPIVRHVDDSIVRVMAGRELVLRRARGFAPLPVQLSPVPTRSDLASGILAVGAHLKNTVALSVGPQAFVSQHIGDLETEPAQEAFRRVIGDFERLYETTPAIVVADAHPDYLSTQFARALVEGRQSPSVGPQTEALRYLEVQHHLAHIFACMAENELPHPLLGVAWDGTGYGLDGTLWGGEFFLVAANSCERLAHLRQFRLPGGDQAAREPRRAALGLLYELLGESAFTMTDLAPVCAFSPAELAPLRTMLSRKLNSPLTSSVGRLFDAVAALAGLRQVAHFEGQAAMELEFSLEDPPSVGAYPFAVVAASRTPQHSPFVLDWQPCVEALLADLRGGSRAAEISAKFHNGLVESIIEIARRCGQQRVALSGGCFQNRYLTERAVRRLQEEGFRPYWHQRVPPNDGGISLGQVVAALRQKV